MWKVAVHKVAMGGMRSPKFPSESPTAQLPPGETTDSPRSHTADKGKQIEGCLEMKASLKGRRGSVKFSGVSRTTSQSREFPSESKEAAKGHLAETSRNKPQEYGMTSLAAHPLLISTKTALDSDLDSPYP